MRCPGCDYPLWNLSGRVCPECGRPFAPSEFQFVPNSVRFLCPHCRQDYYGTGAGGHLVPREFDCVRCGGHINEDDMLLLPTEGVEEEQTQVDQVPWLVRAKVGIFRAWAGTLWRVLFNPLRLARTTPADSSVAQAWFFAMLTLAATSVGGVAVTVVLMTLIAGGGAAGIGVGGAFGGVALVALVICAAAIPLWGLLAHFLLCVMGRPALGPGATVRTICYASGACLLPAVPCLGSIFGWFAGWFWPALSAAIMLTRVQRIGPVRATIAAFSGPVLLWGAVALYIFAVIVPSVSTAYASMAAAEQAAAQANLKRIASALATYAQANGGAYPAHPIDLVEDGSLTIAELSPPSSRMGAGPGKGRASILDRWQILGPAQQEALKSRLDAARGFAQRLGDTVFLTGGQAPADFGPKMWVVVYDPPPGATDFAGKPIPIQVIAADGTFQTIQPAALGAALKEQNAVRGTRPPIPDLSTITEGGPSGGP